MTRLHDSTRRQICVALFTGLCVLPTLGVGGFAIERRLPWHRQAEEARLSAELGLTVTIGGSMTHPLPGVVHYTDLKLTDPETGRDLLVCRELDATWTAMPDAQGQTRPAIVLEARQMESAASAWPRLKEVLRRNMECQNGRPEVEVRLSADRWILHDGDNLQILGQVAGGIGLNRQPQGVQSRLEFRLGSDPAARPMLMRMVRDRQVEPPVYRFVLDADPNNLPPSVTALAQALAPSDERLARAPGAPDGLKR